MNLAEYVDSKVDLFGIAENAMAGAILRCGQNSHVYIDGLREWNDNELHCAFEITGLLVEEGDDADSIDDGTAMHGIGRHYVVKNATRERLS